MLSIPDDVPEAVKPALRAIATWARRYGGTGGCRAFFSAKEWEELGNQSWGAAAIVCHDGGALSIYNGRKPWHDYLRKKLENLGYRTDVLTSVSTGLYLIKDDK